MEAQINQEPTTPVSFDQQLSLAVHLDGGLTLRNTNHL